MAGVGRPDQQREAEQQDDETGDGALPAAGTAGGRPPLAPRLRRTAPPPPVPSPYLGVLGARGRA